MAYLLYDYTRKLTNVFYFLYFSQIDDQDAVVIVEKTPFREETLTELLTGSKLKLEMRNDIYSSYQLQAPPHLNGIVLKISTESGWV